MSRLPCLRCWRALDAFERYLHTEDGLPPLLRLACIHYQFEAIHPFIDGNGRIGRLLIPLLMVSWGLLPHPLLYLSVFFERRRDEYYRLLMDVSTGPRKQRAEPRGLIKHIERKL